MVRDAVGRGAQQVVAEEVASVTHDDQVVVVCLRVMGDHLGGVTGDQIPF